MGSQVCKGQDLDDQDQLISEFIPTKSVMIAYQYNNQIEKIKKIRQIIDPRTNYALKWYESRKYGFKILGSINWRRPIGQSLFYFDQQFVNKQKVQINQSDQTISQKNPIIITTKISQNYQFSPQTLIIYQDHSYYIGQISTLKYQIPRATGKGLLVTKQFIYQGEFVDGYPEGFGRYRTKYLQFTGQLRKGLPYGECIQKTAKGLFMGRFDQKSKIGFLITPENKRIEINQNNSLENNIKL